MASAIGASFESINFTSGINLDILHLYFFIIALFASAISAVVGFGSALILIAASSMVYDIKWSIAITTFLYFYNSALKSYSFRQSVDVSLTLKMTALAIPGVFLGGYFLLNIQAQVIHILLALVALLYLAIDFFKFNSQITVADKLLYGSGFIYGFISGAAGSGSIVKAIVFKHIQLPKEVFVATMAASALPLNIIKIGIFSAGAIIGFSDIPLILLLLVASYLGTQLGKKVLVKISQSFFEKLVRLMLLVLSIKLLYSAIV